jgi:hypothetical protein
MLKSETTSRKSVAIAWLRPQKEIGCQSREATPIQQEGLFDLAPEISVMPINRREPPQPVPV